MDTTKALAVAKNMRQHFEAFRELEDFLTTIASLKNAVKELNRAHAEAKIELEAESKRLEAARAQSAAEKEAQETALTQRRNRFNLEKAEQERVITDLKERRGRMEKEATEAFERQQARHETMMRNMEQKRQEAAADLDRIKSETAAYRRSLEHIPVE